MFKRFQQSLFYLAVLLFAYKKFGSKYLIQGLKLITKDIKSFHWTVRVLTLAIKNLLKKETLASICFGANSRHATYKKGRVYSKEICNNMELCMHYALRTKRGKR